MEENLKIMETNHKFGEIAHFYPRVLCIWVLSLLFLFTGNIHVSLGSTKTQSLGTRMDLHWQLPELYFYVNPSLICFG